MLTFQNNIYNFPHPWNHDSLLQKEYLRLFQSHFHPRLLYLPSFRCFQNKTCDVSSLLKVILTLIQFFSFFPLPSALNIHKAPLTGPLSVIASLIIRQKPLPVISLVQPTVKPLRRKDLRFFL